MMKLLLFVAFLARDLCTAAHLDDQQGCTRLGRICLRGAVCNDRTKECECTDGLDGDGMMYCGDPSSEKLCTVSCDPHVVTFGGAHAALNLPCAYRVAAFMLPVQESTNTLRVDFYARNYLTTEGLFFVDAVHINLQLLNRTGHVIDTITFSITAQDIWQAEGSNPWAYNKTTKWQGMAMYFFWEHADAFALFMLPGGCKLRFRAFIKHERPQKHKPGLVLVVPNGLQFIPLIDGMCSYPGSNSTLFQDLAARHRTKTRLVSLYLGLFLKDELNFDPPVCKSSKTTWTNCTNNRYMAINLCGFILNDKTVLRCLQDAGEIPMQVFDDCLVWACEFSKKKCNAVRTLLEENDCLVRNLFRKVGCKRRSLLRANRRQNNIDRITEMVPQ